LKERERGGSWRKEETSRTKEEKVDTIMECEE